MVDLHNPPSFEPTVFSAGEKMAEVLSELKVGDLYSNEEIYCALRVGNAGGMRTKTDGSCPFCAADFGKVGAAGARAFAYAV
ncbi:MAG: hypothetical protein K2X38_14410, partial [Gemmataceae bacterium]|nr:hypothetical protein [Gemmataceae bacterium]